MAASDSLLIGSIEQLEYHLDSLRDTLSILANSIGNKKAGGEKKEESGSILGDIGDILGGLGAAATALQDSFNQVVGAALPFVAAFNPGLIEVFSQQIGDLAATIGSGLQPIFEALIPVIGQLADIIGPVMDSLAPVIAELAEIFTALIIPAARIFALLLQSIIIPVIKFLADVLKFVIKAFFTFIASILKFLSSLPLIGGFAKKALNGLVEAFNPKKEQGGRKFAAPKDFGFSGIEGILKSNILAAQRGNVADKDTNEYLSDIYDVLKEIRDKGDRTYSDKEIETIRSHPFGAMGMFIPKAYDDLIKKKNPKGAGKVNEDK